MYKSQSSESIDTECRATLKSALQLAAEGILVFPLKRNSKEPEPRSRGFKDATTNRVLIGRWFDNDYGRNLAIRTGSVSGVFVVDADSLEALEHFEAFFGKLPVTRQSQTSRGAHFFFKTPPIIPLSSSTSRVWPGIDIKSDNGYVVAPPSRHPDGITVYRWVDSEAPIVEPPTWLLLRARKPPPPEPPPRQENRPRPTSGGSGAYGAAALRKDFAGRVTVTSAIAEAVVTALRAGPSAFAFTRHYETPQRRGTHWSR